jgi:hypothetical protein
VQLTAQFILQFQSTEIDTLPLYLVVFNIDNGSVLAIALVNVPRDSLTTSDISVSIPVVSGKTMSKLCCALVAGVDNFYNDLVVSQAELLQFCYLFTN